MWYAIAAAVVVSVGALVWIIVQIRASRANAQAAANLQKQVSIREKQLEEANKPRDPQSIRDSLLNDSF